ncbi:MAG: hypothetical protein BWX80_03802 [Candidatus Hydrogenedentes bacterium ADurb.Bin101]|nr:MAG: hypothetical protein BWX80_03802 [Candidatus Hydrogenedentes bacterium ADurb.Bin101]
MPFMVEDERVVRTESTVQVVGNAHGTRFAGKFNVSFPTGTHNGIAVVAENINIQHVTDGNVFMGQFECHIAKFTVEVFRCFDTRAVVRQVQVPIPVYV